MDREEKKKQQLIKLFCGFLIFMVIFTFLSRAADSLTIAQVEIEHPSSRVIEHTVSSDGKTIQNQELGIIVEEGIRIKTICVKEGDSVKKGDLLLILDQDQLDEVIEEVEKQIKTLELTNESLDSSKEIERQMKQTAQRRAESDYQQIKRNQSALVKQAKTDLENAKEALRQYRKNKKKKTSISNELRENFSEQEQNNMLDTQNEISENNKDRLNNDALPNDQESILSNNNQKNTISQDNHQQNSTEQDSEITEKELIANIKEKSAAYKEVLRNQSDALETAKRSIEDANIPTAEDNSDEINDLQIDTYEKKLKKLEKLKKKKGKIVSPVEGVITAVTVMTGNITTEEAAFRMADLSSGLRFVAQFPKDQEKYLTKDASVSLTPDGNGETQDGFTIESVTPNTEDESMLDVSVLIKNQFLTIGQTAAIKVTQESKNYSTTVSLSSLREGAQDKYVLVMQKKETVLGEEWFAQKIPVTLLDKNETFAALEEGTLSEEQSVILSSNKSIDDGDRVRLTK